MSAEMNGHPREPETFTFSETWRDERGQVTRMVKSHVAYDDRWPWWRRLWANLRGRP